MRKTMEGMLDDARLMRAAERLRPDADPAEVAARAAWSVLVEPGDGVAGALVAAHGAQEALGLALDPHRLLTPGVVDAKLLAEAQERWRPRARSQSVVDAMDSCAEVGGRLLLPGDSGWPAGIDDLGPHAPLVLWARGDLDALVDRPAVAMVGARAATPYGEAVAAEIGGDLARDGIVVVSGGAYGIDGSSHRAALGVGGTTVAFLAGGVDRAYPVGHQQLFDRIRRGGAVLAEVPCGGAPTKWRFLQRNRLIAAASLATVVVEAGWRSGTLNTAGHAAALGRPLGAVPGPITSAASSGCHRLLREYDAVCVTSAQEVRELWGAAPLTASPSERESPEQVRLRDAMSTRTAREPADLAARCGLAVDQVRGLLGLLALEGAVVQTPEGWRRTS
ncbi:DNA-processing protein DprA [Microbacterium sp. ARD32]|uniref:DNA-processing protein DprA n=1 Tax=Microbacterium sp. ARD32 TaxID=2962577 RepID=UPI002881DD03|nr:DNA-processing protein DprA [Microbacterium sp. ARD32]MDT0157066.1 DNA-processing protein DprA [Microbacterium sp. ARD32]